MPTIQCCETFIWLIILAKGWFPYDRGSQIADRNKSVIVCDHMETHFCDRLRSCDRDRRRSQKIELSPAIVCDHLRSIAIVQSYGNQSFSIRDRNASHNIRVLSHDSTLVCSIVAMVSVATLISLSSWLRLNMLWRKLHVLNVFTIATAKILRTSTKRPTVGTKSARSLIYQPGKRRPNFAT